MNWSMVQDPGGWLADQVKPLWVASSCSRGYHLYIRILRIHEHIKPGLVVRMNKTLVWGSSMVSQRNRFLVVIILF